MPGRNPRHPTRTNGGGNQTLRSNVLTTGSMNTRFTQQTSAALALSGMRSRRRFLQQSGLGLGSVALSCLLQDEAAARETGPVSLASRKAPLPAKARHVIHIFAGGAGPASRHGKRPF